MTLRGSTAAIALACTACVDSPSGIASPEGPAFEGVTVTTSPHSVLAAGIDVRVRHADSVLVLYRDEDGHEGATPAFPVSSDSMRVPVLGLRAARTHAFTVVAYGPGGTAASDPLELTTGELPNDLPRYAASGTEPSPGYVVFSAGDYGLVIDNAGRVVWYRRIPDGAGLAFVAQPDGRYATRPRFPDASGGYRWIEIDPSGDIVRTLRCARGLQPRLHDLIALPGGDVWILCDETRTLDLSSAGGHPQAGVTGTVVQHIAADGTLLFEWSPFDHFSIFDAAPESLTGPTVNWTHGNSLDLDADGNLLVSFRNLGEVTKIDARTGEVLWRLGGMRSGFAFAGLPEPGFAGQHGIRADASGTLLLLDNVGNPGESRAERYAIDEVGRIARLVGSWSASPPASTVIGGSVQALPGDRVLVSFGTAGRVEEYDVAGRVVWSVEGEAGYVFRAQRIASLYAPGAGTTR